MMGWLILLVNKICGGGIGGYGAGGIGTISVGTGWDTLNYDRVS